LAVRIITVWILALTLASSAQAADVDWKMYGIASVDGGVVCFYDANGLTRTADRHVRVWAKCLLQSELDSIDIKTDFGGRIVENAARKVVKGYMPPIAFAENIDFDQGINVIRYEETANISGIQPQARFFYELNCSERMMRRLSTYVRTNGRDGYSDTPSGWEYVPPEGSGATLLKILCPVQ
jgi:hypothetical protein